MKEGRERISDLAPIEFVIRENFDISISNLAPIPTQDLGDNCEVLSGFIDGQKVFVKLLEDPRDFQVESAAFKLLGDHGIASPKVLGLLEKANGIGKAIIIETAAEGRPLSQLSAEEQSPKLFKKAGAYLKSIHDIKLDGFGPLDVSAEVVRGTMPTWKNNVEFYRHDFNFLRERQLITDEELKTLEDTYQKLIGVDLPVASFIHGDFGKSHIFTDGNEITGVIDFGNAYAGDPRKDIATANFFMTPTETENFNQGYGEMASDPLMPYYRLMLAATKLEYRIKKGYLDRVPRAMDKLKQYMKEVKG